MTQFARPDGDHDIGGNWIGFGGASAPWWDDLDDDGNVDDRDRDVWLSLAASRNGFAEPFLLGDSNLDGA